MNGGTTGQQQGTPSTSKPLAVAIALAVAVIFALHFAGFSFVVGAGFGR